MASSFCTQANALLRKNLIYQKRNYMANVRLICFPVLLCLLFTALQFLLNNITRGHPGSPEPSPLGLPLLLQVPESRYRAVRSTSLDSSPSDDLPDGYCRVTGTCPVTVLFTGRNRSLGEAVMVNLFPKSFFTQDTFDNWIGPSQDVLGTSEPPPSSSLETINFSNLYSVQRQCPLDWTFPLKFPGHQKTSNVACIQGLSLWRDSSSTINDQLYKGYMKGNRGGDINEITAAYDLLNTSNNNFDARIWYNSTFASGKGGFPALLRVSRSVNMVANAYLQFLRGPETKILFEFLKEMPTNGIPFRMDLSSALGPMFFIWVLLQLFPVVLTSLVYEKEQKLRIMMKMHGLGDGPYLMITYVYFLIISSIYTLCFVLFGSFVGLKFFMLNAYSIQFTFFFIYINLQIALAFLASWYFSNVKTATVVAYIGVFGTGLLGGFLFQNFVEDTSFPRFWIIILELYPGFSLYRGLYEFSQYAINGDTVDGKGMQWSDLTTSTNGMMEVLFIMAIEWLVILCIAYYMDRHLSTGSRTSCIFSLKNFVKKRPPSSIRQTGPRRQDSNVHVQMEKPDIAQERERVEQLLLQHDSHHVVLCDDLKKVYPGRDGNPEKLAVRGLSLALPRGECFGMLGPNGAGKTSFISMMIGLTEPTSGTAYIQGLDIRTRMGEIYTSMGVCPQHDLLWENLTGREHLLFYGRLKNLSGSALTQSVEKSLKDVNLFSGGVADKQVHKYSGGMKRRLSVAISLIGNPSVVYMDEPSTGLDPASRKHLWDAVKLAKQDCAIILTTHSMEEADILCDRLGIFVDGSLQCIGNPKELKARYGGSYVLTMTTPQIYEEHVENMVRHLSPRARRIYQISGTQKFELPKHEVRIADVFQAVENAKRFYTVQAWGLADTTLEDVFIKVAREAEALNVLS
ncbi:hypothetical protein MLD38_021849 [Melastoma candidum]|uniref:Uncharacterized protein n=1 Tax=Melastoma candidum TaxID=119954 RepID=A0ACB9QHL7_9MYRT|nr:hypothetical protein MLD38_021849 [Melastoma candidum]